MNIFKALLELPADKAPHCSRLSGTGSGYLVELLYEQKRMDSAHVDLSDEMIRFSSLDGEVYLP